MPPSSTRGIVTISLERVVSTPGMKPGACTAKPLRGYCHRLVGSDLGHRLVGSDLGFGIVRHLLHGRLAFVDMKRHLRIGLLVFLDFGIPVRSIIW